MDNKSVLVDYTEARKILKDSVLRGGAPQGFDTWDGHYFHYYTEYKEGKVTIVMTTVVLELDMTDVDTRSLLYSRGLAPATIGEIMAYGKECWDGKKLLVATGSQADIGNCWDFPCIYRRDGGRHFGLTSQEFTQGNNSKVRWHKGTELLTRVVKP